MLVSEGHFPSRLVAAFGAHNVDTLCWGLALMRVMLSYGVRTRNGPPQHSYNYVSFQVKNIPHISLLQTTRDPCRCYYRRVSFLAMAISRLMLDRALLIANHSTLLTHRSPLLGDG